MSGRMYSWSTVDDLLDCAAKEIEGAVEDGCIGSELAGGNALTLLRAADLMAEIIESQGGAALAARRVVIRELRKTLNPDLDRPFYRKGETL